MESTSKTNNVNNLHLIAKTSDSKLQDLVNQYKKLHQNQCGNQSSCKYLLTIPKCKDFRDCIIAGKQGHQKRISQQTIEETIAALQDSSILSRSYNDFEELYDNVEKIIYHIPGIGRLTLYDISVRIGANLIQPPIFPKDYVYLHAGALEGAKRLFGEKSLPFRIPISCLPAVLQQLGSLDIENFLCIFKNQLP